MFNPSTITTLYVSRKKGDNKRNYGFSSENTYLSEGPLATLEKALSYVAELRSNGNNQPITIFIEDEVYPVEKPIVITPDMHSVTIKPMTKTLISGGFEIKGFKEDIFNGQRCFSAYVPEIKEKGIWFTDLYVDGLRADFTRYPDSGTLEPESVENDNHALWESSSWFIAKKEDVKTLSEFKNFSDCFISYNHYWIDEHTPIRSFDIESGKIEFEYPSTFTISPKFSRSALHYIIENVAEGFRNPNEWYLDRETSKVYYIPRNELQTPETISVVAPLTDKLFILKGEKNKKLSYIHLENLEFAYTKGDYSSTLTNPITGEEKGYASDEQSVNRANGSVELHYTDGCYIENSVFHSLGLHALTVNNGCSGTKICNNHIYDIGAGGIKIGGEGYLTDENGEEYLDDAELNYGNTIRNNRIEKCGRRYFAGCGILIKHSFNNHIAHNDISDIYYTGVSVGWVWGHKKNVAKNNLIEKNHIHNIGNGALSDMGGVYILGEQPGTVIRNNIIHDINCLDYGAWGIYLDEGSSYITVEKNLCYNLGRNAFNQHYGRMNTVINNIFLKSNQTPVRVGGTFINNFAVFERNILVSEGTDIYRSMYDEDENHESSPHNIVSRRNLIFDTKGKAVLIGTHKKVYLEEFTAVYGKEKYSIEEDPMFVDYENNDFRLKKDSPAYSIGFEDIDFDDVGII